MLQLHTALTFVLALSSTGISALPHPNAGRLSTRSHNQAAQSHGVSEARRLEARMNFGGSSGSGAGSSDDQHHGSGGKAPPKPRVRDQQPQGYFRNKNAVGRVAKQKAREAEAAAAEMAAARARAAAVASQALLGTISRPMSRNVTGRMIGEGRHENRPIVFQNTEEYKPTLASIEQGLWEALQGAGPSRPTSGNVAQPHTSSSSSQLLRPASANLLASRPVLTNLQPSRQARTNPSPPQYGRTLLTPQFGSAPITFPLGLNPLNSSGFQRVPHLFTPQSASHSIPFPSTSSPQPRRTPSPPSPSPTPRKWSPSQFRNLDQ